MPNDSILSRSRERPSTDQCSSSRSEGSRLQIVLTPNPARARRISSESPCCVPTLINAFRAFAFESPDWRGGFAATCAVTTASVNAPAAIPLPATRTNFRRSISIHLAGPSHNVVCIIYVESLWCAFRDEATAVIHRQARIDRIEFPARCIHEKLEANEPAAAATPWCGRDRRRTARPAQGRSSGNRGQVRNSTWTVRRALTVRERRAVDAAVEDTGDRIELHSTGRIGRHADAILVAVRAASLGNSDDRSRTTSADHSRHGRSAVVFVRSGHHKTAVDFANNGS